MAEPSSRRSSRRTVYYVLLFPVTAVLALIALMIPMFSSRFELSAGIGQVASQDIRAPREITFVSEVYTQQKEEAAERAVLPVYTSPDTSIARQQMERLQVTLAYISSVRADAFASEKQKLDDLAALEDIRLSPEIATKILGLSDPRWQAVQQETMVVLEQVMRSPIRAETVEAVRGNVPASVSLALPEGQASIVAHLVAAFVTPNSLYSETLTEVARSRARGAVEPVSRSFVVGQTVVSRGQVMAAADVEALQQLGLVQPKQKWQDPASAAGLTILMAAFTFFFLHRNRVASARTPRSLSLIAMLFLAFLFGARLTIPDHTVVPYAYPLAAFSLIVTALFGAELALFFSLPLAIMAAYGLPNAFDLTLYYIMGSLFGVLALGKAQRIGAFFWAGMAIAAAGATVVVVYRLPLASTDWIGLATLAGAALFNGAAAAGLTVLMQFFLAQFLGTTTPLQLMELTRPDHPLMQMILREAPGTYQHSLQVANLAEQAAERIGADPLLTRVGALYHDSGKALNPIFFIENQVPGFLNPHDDLDPVTSASTIIRHVPDGVEVARKHRLPGRLLDFITEHHGTMITRYQYVRAVTLAGGDESQVDMEQFRYPGPRPQSRETAILMLADGCEARVRAEVPRGEDDLRNLVKNVIEQRVASGQLDDTTLTLHDLDEITDSFTGTLRGIYHPRIQYPKLESSSREATVPVSSFAAPSAADIPVQSSIDESSAVP